MSEKHWFEREMELRMVNDGWEKVPQKGDHYNKCFESIFAYIDWIREKAGLLQPSAPIRTN